MPAERSCVLLAPRRQFPAVPAFTLIEVLVVVAIIALLVAILVPSLRRARDQAKIASCKANCKQVGTMMATHQAEYRGAVPVAFNYASNSSGNHGPIPPPARTCWLSVALRHYSGAASMRRMGSIPDGCGGTYDPNVNWDNSKRRRYEDEVMDEVWVCPFERGRGAGWKQTGEITISGVNGDRDYTTSEWRGKHDTYHTWKWEGNILRREVPHSHIGGTPGDVYPTDPNPSGAVARDVDGRPKYSAISWNWVYARNPNYDPLPGFQQIDVIADKAYDLNRKWTPNDARRIKASSLSDVTAVFCAQGQSMGLGFKIRNLGSHRTSAGGGTNVVFGDTHVEWLKGTQVGWE